MNQNPTLFRASCVAVYEPMLPDGAQVSMLKEKIRRSVADAATNKAVKVENDLYTMRASIEVYILTPDEMKSIILANQGRDALREGFRWLGN